MEEKTLDEHSMTPRSISMVVNRPSSAPGTQMEGKMAHWKTNNIEANQTSSDAAKLRRGHSCLAKSSLILPDIENIRRSKSVLN